MNDGEQGPTGRQSARSALTTNLRRLFAIHESAAARGVPVEAVLEQLEQRTTEERRFSINNQGFLDGAVETGARAAKEIVAQL